MSDAFLGYVRPDGAVGVRNHVAILAVMDNVNGIVRHLASLVKGTVALPVWYGRGQFGEDDTLFRRTQIGLASNPNIAAVFVVSLDSVSAARVAETIARTGKPVAHIAVQDVGGTIEALAHGARVLLGMVKEASRAPRVVCPLSKLVLGVECGGTDTTSGIASNPALGFVADRVVAAGGTVYLSETSEWMGAEQVLARRAESPAVAEAIWTATRRIEADALSRGVDIRGANPVPDNIRGGITTLEEKSLGAIIKGGTTPVRGVLPYATRGDRPGLHLMDTAAPAAESMTGLAAGGAQVILFSTGQMNIMGCTVSPTVKVTGNPRTASRMRHDVDVDVSAMLEGETLEAAGSRLFQFTRDVAGGALTASEILGNDEIAISRLQPTV